MSIHMCWFPEFQPDVPALNVAIAAILCQTSAMMDDAAKTQPNLSA